MAGQHRQNRNILCTKSVMHTLSYALSPGGHDWCFHILRQACTHFTAHSSHAHPHYIRAVTRHALPVYSRYIHLNLHLRQNLFTIALSHKDTDWVRRVIPRHIPACMCTLTHEHLHSHAHTHTHRCMCTLVRRWEIHFRSV